MVTIQVRNVDKRAIDWDLLKHVGHKTLEHEGKSDKTDVTIVIDNDEQLRSLNNQYRDFDESTDVLSFSLNELDPQTGNCYLGDVIISFQKAQSQAVMKGYKVEDELSLLVVHGVLHLLGYDHNLEENKREMWLVQRQVLEIIGVKMVDKLIDDL
jgi:probable rRNA maturation factor